MITKVIGKVNGEDVVFDQIDNGMWSVIVPSTLQGCFIVEAKAFDEAGNMAFTAKMLFIIDVSKLCVHIIPYPFSADRIESNYVPVLLNGGFKIRLHQSGLHTQLCRSRYWTELKEPKCEIGGGHNV